MTAELSKARAGRSTLKTP